MFGNLKELPEPMGNYEVGITQIDFKDKDRIGVYECCRDVIRELTATFYYPAEKIKDQVSAPYAFLGAVNCIKKVTLNLVSNSILKVKTHCYLDLPISSKEMNYPVIIFNHGYASYSMQNTVLCSDLASYGYIVASIGHPYEASAVKYLDGRIVEMNKEYFKLPSKAPFIGSIKLKYKAYSDSEIMKELVANNNKYSKKMSDNVKIWVEDTKFIATQLEKINKGDIISIFKGKLKLKIGIALSGHSFGGTTAAQACLDDSRFVCGVNIDGVSYGDYLYKDIQKPFMVLGSPSMKNFSRTTFLFNSEDTYMVLVNRTAHLGFTDALFTARQLNIVAMLGKRNIEEFRKIITKYHLIFFEKYLLGNESMKIRDLKYDDIEYLERLKS